MQLKKFKYQYMLEDYIGYLKNKKIFKKKNQISYEVNIERLNNWKNSDINKIIKWYENVRKIDSSKVTNIHLEKLIKWSYNKQKGIITHKSKKFFIVQGKRITNSKREIASWDQPFLTQVGYKGGVIGLVRCKINKIPHYLIDAKFEPGNYNEIQLSPSLQGTYSNLDRVHHGERNKVLNKFFRKKFKTIKKMWVTEDGGRLFKKRNLHWIIEYYGKPTLPSNRYKWLTLWEIDKLIKHGPIVGPHLRAILSLL
tara:strand:+ start:644 stop:1405 length:762 start_codon:yes stop_codon:yes gene_type:complete